MADIEKDLQVDSLMAVAAAPHVKSDVTTAQLMRDVVIALIPTSLAGVYFFGLRSILIMAVAIIAAVLSEAITQKIFGKDITINDWSAVVTGLLIALNCPVDIPLWQVAFGSVFAIVIVKQFFGGLGSNFMNPALAARAVMMISFGQSMSTFSQPLTAAVSSAAPAADAVSVATPLSGGELPSYIDLFLGNMPGVIGEVSKAALLIGALYLLVRKVITIEVPLVYILTTIITLLVFGRGQEDLLAHLLTGGLIMGAFFMATDYATIPINKRGKIIFAIGCGFLTGMIRLFGSNPEGVCYSIIIMNMFVPLIDRLTRRKPFGLGGKENERSN